MAHDFGLQTASGHLAVSAESREPYPADVEARLRAEAAVVQASGAIVEEAGIRPSITVKQGDPVKAVQEMLKERTDIAAFVLGAAAEGSPGPLIAHFCGNAGTLPCPLMIVPGGLGEEALDQLS